MPPAAEVCVVIPCYRCRATITSVLERVPADVGWIVCVDDACPEGSGDFIREHCPDPRVEVIRNPVNLGVGGATMAGYRRALELGASIVVKIDSDGQMDPALVASFVAPIREGTADYTKGNRFYDLRLLQQMPRVRLIGNAALSFLSKLSSGYWDIMDPTNGYTAVAAPLLARLPLERIDQRYFFESDLLFRLSTFRAVVLDIPMQAVYADEQSHLSPGDASVRFAGLHVNRFVKRIFYNYFLRNFNVASLNLVLGSLLTLSGLGSGYLSHTHYASLGTATPTGVIIVVALQLLIGFQLLLSFINFDVAQVPRRPVSGVLASQPLPRAAAGAPADRCTSRGEVR